MCDTRALLRGPGRAGRAASDALASLVQIVFDSGVEVAMVPLEVTHTALATPAVCSEIKALGTPFADMILDLIHFFTVRKRPPLLPTGAALHSPSPPHPLPYGLRRCPSRATKWRARDRSIQETYRTIFGFASPPVHDVCAVALVAQPHLFTTQLMRVDVGASHPLCAARLVAGRRRCGVCRVYVRV